MSCPTNTYLEGLKHPTKFKAIQNEDEELFSVGYAIVKNETDKLTNLGWNYDKVGKRNLAGLYYKGANIHLYLFHFALYIRRYMKAEGTLDDPCVPSKATIKYRLECVERNLPCLSKTYGTNYVDTWNKLKDSFGIEKDATCYDCCSGLGFLSMSSSNDCTGLIIGDCSQLT